MVGTRDLAALADAADAGRRRSSCWSATIASCPRSRPAARSARSPTGSARSSCARSAASARPGTATRSPRCATATSSASPATTTSDGRHRRGAERRTRARARSSTTGGRRTSAASTALMIAHRRRDVADLNARARERDAAARAARRRRARHRRARVRGRRPRRRDPQRPRDLGVVNGAARRRHRRSGAGRLDVELDHGRRVDLPEQYVRDGHLDHGYAITAHRAQGATVDRAFVLGSDELYREWGYTALSRHRDEARFYVSATPTFLNESPAPLQAGDDVADHVARMLRTSRAEHLALSGVKADSEGERFEKDRDRAREHVLEINTRLDVLRGERAQTRWYRRSRRADVERLVEGWQRGQDHWQAEIARLTEQLEARPAPSEPELWRGARSPLRSGSGSRRRAHAPARTRSRF